MRKLPLYSVAATQLSHSLWTMLERNMVRWKAEIELMNTVDRARKHGLQPIAVEIGVFTWSALYPGAWPNEQFGVCWVSWLGPARWDGLPLRINWGRGYYASALVRLG